MTVSEAQTLFTSLGPEWRIFIYFDEFSREADIELLVPKVDIINQEEGWFYAEVIAVDWGPRGIHFGALSVRQSPPEGSLLDAKRQDGQRMEFSNITLTDLHRGYLKQWEELTSD